MLKSAIVAVFMFVNTGEGLVVDVVKFNDYNSCHEWLKQYGEAPSFDMFCMDKNLFDAMKVRHTDRAKNTDIRKSNIVN